MNDLIARMMGRRVNEDVPVPVAAKRRQNPRELAARRHAPQMRTAAAIMGMTEDVGMSIIPDDAEEIETMTGTTGLKLKDERTPEPPEREPGAPIDAQAADEPEEILTPKDILVAPDVTPELFTPIDPSDVPAPPQAAQPPPQPPETPTHGGIDPLEVLLGRRSTRASPGEGQPRAMPKPENIVTAESAQATVNVSLGVGVGDVLGKGRPMPDPTPANPSKIVEAMRSFVS
jgi:hypothetical protein